MINTDVKQKEMQTWCQQRTKSLKRSPPQLLLLYLASEHFAEWQKKVSLLCLNTVAGYSEEAPSILGVYYHSYAYHYFLALVELISRWIQIFGEPRVFTFCAFHNWSIEQSDSVPTFLGPLQTGCKWLRTKHTTIHSSTEWDGFFPWEFDRLYVFQKLPEEIQSKIVYFYSVIDEYSPRSRGVYSTPSWHKWSDFEYRPWCLAILVRTPPGLSVWNRRLKSHLLIKNVEPSRA